MRELLQAGWVEPPPPAGATAPPLPDLLAPGASRPQVVSCCVDARSAVTAGPGSKGGLAVGKPQGAWKPRAGLPCMLLNLP